MSPQLEAVEAELPGTALEAANLEIVPVAASEAPFEDVTVVERRDGSHQRPKAARTMRASQVDDDLLLNKDRWAQGYDWPVMIWIAAVHIGAVGTVFLHLEGPGPVRVFVLVHRLDRRLHGLSPLSDARQLRHLPADAVAAGPDRRAVGRRLGADLGGQSSQAPFV